MVYGTYNYSYWGESKPTNITGGPHIVGMFSLRRSANRSDGTLTILRIDGWFDKKNSKEEKSWATDSDATL